MDSLLSARNLTLLKANNLLKAELSCLAKTIEDAGTIGALGLLLTNNEELCHEMEMTETLGHSGLIFI